jgi:hypothetical protein
MMSTNNRLAYSYYEWLLHGTVHDCIMVGHALYDDDGLPAVASSRVERAYTTGI